MLLHLFFLLSFFTIQITHCSEEIQGSKKLQEILNSDSVHNAVIILEKDIELMHKITEDEFKQIIRKEIKKQRQNNNLDQSFYRFSKKLRTTEDPTSISRKYQVLLTKKLLPTITKYLVDLETSEKVELAVYEEELKKINSNILNLHLLYCLAAPTFYLTNNKLTFAGISLATYGVMLTTLRNKYSIYKEQIEMLKQQPLNHEIQRKINSNLQIHITKLEITKI